MRFRDVAVDREQRFSLGIEEDSGRFYVSIPVSNALVDYEEYYEIDRSTFEGFRADLASALGFVARCRNRELTDRLIVGPGEDDVPPS